MTRGTGKTTQQMKDAPIGALFVWCNQSLDYPRRLQGGLNRHDIKVVSPRFIMSQCWRGQEYSAVVVDHDYRSTNPHNPLFYEYLNVIRIKK